jgi:predicted acylesterase/phospholipase RssA
MIWEAARATSAATTFFDSIEIQGESFVDGAFGNNNPISEMWTEAGDLWADGSSNWRLEDNLSCVVSIGTGIPAFGQLEDSVKGVLKTLKRIATDCEKVAEDFERHHQSLDGRYFRFNVDRGLEDVGLEEFNRQSQIVSATRQYLERQASLDRMKQFSLAIRARSCT